MVVTRIKDTTTVVYKDHRDEIYYVSFNGKDFLVMYTHHRGFSTRAFGSLEEFKNWRGDIADAVEIDFK